MTEKTEIICQKHSYERDDLPAGEDRCPVCADEQRIETTRPPRGRGGER